MNIIKVNLDLPLLPIRKISIKQTFTDSDRKRNTVEEQLYLTEIDNNLKIFRFNFYWGRLYAKVVLFLFSLKVLNRKKIFSGKK